MLEGLLNNIFGRAEQADRKARTRTLRDLDAATTTLAEVCKIVLDTEFPDDAVRGNVFARFNRDMLRKTLDDAGSLVRPHDNVFYQELQETHRRVRLFLNPLLSSIRFAAAPAGESVVAALDYLRQHDRKQGRTQHLSAKH